jgi:hypothetical protein
MLGPEQDTDVVLCTKDFVPQIVIEELCRDFCAKGITEKKHMLLIISRDLHIDISMVVFMYCLFFYCALIVVFAIRPNKTPCCSRKVSKVFKMVKIIKKFAGKMIPLKDISGLSEIYVKHLFLSMRYTRYK